jgi:hypothetical protein
MEAGDITRLLGVANEGDPEAMRAVLTMLYDRLRVIARRELAREERGHTLETRATPRSWSAASSSG